MPVRWDLQLHEGRASLLSYGISILFVAIAVGLSIGAHQLQLRDIAFPLLCLAIAVTTWSQGVGPGTLAVLLATLSYSYFFADPINDFRVSTRDLPRFLLFIFWAAAVAYFAARQRRNEQDLRKSRDYLQIEVDQRRQREEEVTQLNEELGKRALELQAANKELESFAYSVSHDLRAPLRHVIGYAELLQKHCTAALDEKGQRYVRTVQDSARRMGNLIDDLLGFSRVGRAETRKTAVSLEQIVREAVSELGQETAGRQIAWKIGALPTCDGDRSMLKLALQNLIGNAVKFTHKRERAEIEIGSMNGKNDEVVVFVRDNGVGFDMRYADKLFGVFQRLHLAEDFEGTGIGLATVQRIIHRHGGQVRAESELDHGATFYVSLPRSKGAA